MIMFSVMYIYVIFGFQRSENMKLSGSCKGQIDKILKVMDISIMYFIFPSFC